VKIQYLELLLISCLLVSFESKEAKGSELKVILNEVVKNSHFLKKRRNSIKAKKQSVKSVRSSYFPSSSFSIGSEYENDSSTYNDNYGTFAKVNLKVPIYNKKTSSSYSEKKVDLKTERKLYELEVNELVQEVLLELLKIDELKNKIDVLRKIEEKVQTERKDMYLRYKTGDKTLTDVRQVKVRLSQYITRTLRNEIDLKNLKKRFKIYINRELKKDIPLSSIKISNIKKKKNLKLKYFRGKVELSDKKLMTKKALKYPVLALNGISEHKFHKFFSEKVKNTSENSIQVSFSIDLFDWNKTDYSVEEYLYKKKAERNLYFLEQQKQNVKEVNLLDQISQTKKIIKNLEWGRDMALKAFKGVRTEFENGNKSSESLLDSEEELFENELLLISEKAQLERLKVSYLYESNALMDYFDL